MPLAILPHAYGAVSCGELAKWLPLATKESGGVLVDADIFVVRSFAAAFHSSPKDTAAVSATK
jgi:hypothetical protein